MGIQFGNRASASLVHLVLLPVLGLSATTAGAATPRLDHVVVVILENKSYDQAMKQPYLSSMAAAGATFTDYRAITHPSQPNYLALWAGSTLGVTNDACPPKGAPFAVENLGHASEAAGVSWRAYSEDLPSPGADDCKANGGRYTRKHDPWTDFSNVNHAFELPYDSLAADIARGELPQLAFVIPGNRHNAHSASIQDADEWLASNMPPILAALGPRGALIVTWDEDDHSQGNRILTIFRGDPVKPGYVSSRPVTHYTLLRTLCDALGLPAFGAAANEVGIDDVWADPPAAASVKTAALTR